MGNILVNVHKSYRVVVAVCDEGVFGRKLVGKSRVESRESRGGKERARRVLDVSGVFFEGKVMSLDEARDEIMRWAREDATFNFVGEESVELAKGLGIVRDEGVAFVDGIPFALVLM